jgi:AraC family transcriptional regulator of arabinose operon
MASKSQIYKLNLHLRHGPVVIGDVLYPPAGVFGPRIQRDYQLVVIHSGSLRLRLDDQWIEVDEHDGILLSPRHREHFYFASDRETHHSWVAISPRFVSSAIRRQLEVQQGPYPFLGRMSSLLELARQVSPAPNEDELLRNEFYRGLAIATICDFASTARNGQGSRNPHAITLMRLGQFISRRYAEPISLLEMAQAAGVSRQHLLRLCRENGKPTPTEQLYARRVEVAADLLLHTGLSVAESAEQSGFVNQFHFSRKFKQVLGYSPLEWRTRVWKSGA